MTQDRPPQRPPQPPPIRARADPPPPESPWPATWHVTFHVLSPSGIPIELERDVVGHELVAWLKRTEETLDKAGFKALSPVQALAASAPPATPDDWAPRHCTDCGAAKDTFYDNRADPHRPAGGPDFKCKCGKGFWKDPRATRRPRR